jgi:predicted component of type VI protein secretion system
MPGPLRSPRDLQDRIRAEADGDPLLIFYDADGAQRIVALTPDRDRMTIGRNEECDIALSWDGQVSRLHAALERAGGVWVLDDGGLSRNGTFVNEARLTDRRRLVHGDVLRFGDTEVEYVNPQRHGATTALPPTTDNVPAVTPAQKAVLVALCRPMLADPPATLPATNAQITAELVLSLDAVKGHLRDLFARFGLAALPPTEKRVRLAQAAIEGRIVRRSDLLRS